MIRFMVRFFSWAAFSSVLIYLGYYLHTEVAPPPIAVLPGPAGIIVDGQRLLSIDRESLTLPGILSIDDIGAGTQRQLFGGQRLTDMAVTQDRRFLVTRLESGELGICDLETEKSWYCDGPINFSSVDNGNSERCLFLTNDRDEGGPSFLLDHLQERLLHRFSPAPSSHSFTPDGKHLILTFAIEKRGDDDLAPTADKPNTVVVWDLENNRLAHQIESYGGPLIPLPDNEHVVVSSVDVEERHIALWNLHSGEIAWKLNSSLNLEMAFSCEVSPDGHWLAVLGRLKDKGCCEFWDLHQRSRLALHPLRERTGKLIYWPDFLLNNRFSPDSSAFVIERASGLVEFYDLGRARVRWRHEIKSSLTSDRDFCWFSADSSRLVVCNQDFLIVRWSVERQFHPQILSTETGKVLREDSRPTRFRYSGTTAPNRDYLLHRVTDPNLSSVRREPNVVKAWLEKLLPFAFDTVAKSNSRIVIVNENTDLVFDFPLQHIATACISPDGKMLAVACRQGDRQWTEFYELPARFRPGLVLGVPMAIGLLLLACRQGWRRWRARRQRARESAVDASPQPS